MLLVVRPRLEAFAHLRERVRWLAQLQDTAVAGRSRSVSCWWPRRRDRRSLGELTQLLAHERLPATVLGQVADDQRAADVVAGRLVAVDRSLLVRSVRQLVEPVRDARRHPWRRPTRPPDRCAKEIRMAVDQALVRRLREEVADILARQRRDDAAAGLPQMSGQDERQFARAVINRVLDSYARTEVGAGRTPPSPSDEEEVAAGIHAALFGVGRLQPLLDDRDVENVDINGCDNVFVQYADGREERMPPVAESDDELVELIQILGAYSGLSSRPFDSANPQLDIRLPDGSRMSAVMDVCSRPSISIRRARLSRVHLDDLVAVRVRDATRSPRSCPPPSRPARTS